MAWKLIILLIVTLNLMDASPVKVGEQVYHAKANIMMTFLGVFNQKAYYIDRVGATQPKGRENCQNMGMRLLKLENMEEVNWLLPQTENVPENRIWTDGVNNIVAASFDWRTDRSRVSDSLTLVQHTHHGLAIDKGIKILRERGMGDNLAYVCYMHTAKTGLPIITADNRVELDTTAISSIDNGIETSGDYKSTPKISFIGRYGKKSYFLENTEKVTQAVARTNCANMGMRLATIDSQGELEWIISVTTAADRPLWTDGVVKEVPASYKWFSDNTPVSNAVQVADFTHIGLDIVNGASLRSFCNTSCTNYFLCYMETS